MVCEITKDGDRSPLLPDRQEQGDFFVCDIFDAAPKGDMASMAHPIFSLSTKPDHRVRRYEDGTGRNYLEVKPSSDGLATIHDRDVLIYCISQIMAALNKGQKVSKIVRLKAFDLLKATNRPSDGRGYSSLRSALARLQGTQIETNIVTGDVEQLDIFSIIDRARIVRETREFKRLVGNIVAQDDAHSHMPDYSVRLVDNMVVFVNRHAEKPPALAAPSGAIRLSSDVYQEARKVAPGWDIYTLEQEWRGWMADGGLDAPANPDKAFLGFCRKVFEKRGKP